MGVASGVSSFFSGKTNAANTRATSAYNAEAQLANGKIQGAVTRFDAIGTKYQALMEADTSRLNGHIAQLNAKVGRIDGMMKSKQLLLEAAFVRADSEEAAESAEFQAFESTKDRDASNSQFQEDLNAISRDARKSKAVAQATYASMGVSIGSDVIDMIESDIAEDEASFISKVMLAATVDNISTSKVARDAKKRAKDARKLGAREISALEISSRIVDLDTDRAEVIADIEAMRLFARGDYMDWFAEFTESSADLRANVLETGAQIQSDSTFAVGQANASSQSSQGLTQALSQLGSAASTFTTRPKE